MQEVLQQTQNSKNSAFKGSTGRLNNHVAKQLQKTPFHNDNKQLPILFALFWGIQRKCIIGTATSKPIHSA